MSGLEAESRTEPDPDRGLPVSIEIAEVLGTGRCSMGLEPGRRWTVDSPRVPEGMCMWAWAALMPFVAPLRFGASLPWENEPRTARVCCPDPANPVVFVLRVVAE